MHNQYSLSRKTLCVFLAAIMLIFVGRLAWAASSFGGIEAESGALSGSAAHVPDAAASAGDAIRFTTSSGGGITLPAPINPGDRDFGRIVRTSAPNGGVVVLPDGNYTVSDVSGFNPANYVVVVAQNPLGAKVIRTANTIGSTDQMFLNSSKLIFVGLEFKDISLALDNSDFIYFWYTRHTYPVQAHPDPTETYCGIGVGPDGIQIEGGSNQFGLFGSTIDGIGHDAIWMNEASNLTIRGTRITNVWNYELQNGRGNWRCGWGGSDNYHNDGLQIYPGGIANLTVENSYFGRHAIPQVDSGGNSNTNLVFRNNMFFEEPFEGGCLAFNARVKPDASAGAIQSMTVQNNDAWCPTSEWIFYVEGTRNNAMTINGTPIPSTAREANSYLTRRTGTPNTASTPAEAWKTANPYDNWPCYLAANAQNFTQSVKQC